MTSEVDRIPVGPPWSVDDVADVHAGVFSAEVTAELRARIVADADGAAILAALDATVDDLSLLPPLVMPARYASRLDRAIAAEVIARADGRPAPVGSPLVTGGFGALLQPAGPVGAPPGLPTLTVPAAGLPGPRAVDPGDAGAPPQWHAPLIPPVLPGADRHQTMRTPPVPRQLGAAPPYAPVSAGPRSGPSASAPPDNRPGRAGGPTGRPTGRGPSDGRSGTVSSLDAQRARRRAWTRGLLATAALAAVAVGTVLGIRGIGSSDTNGVAAPVTLSSTTTVAAPGSASPGPGAGSGAGLQAFAIEPGKFAEAFDKLNGVREGKLTEAPVFASCLGQNNVSGSDVLGVSDVTYQGRDAMAVAVSIAGDTAHVRILVVGTGCGPNGPELLADETVTR
jgi:hypothetical protein